MPTSRLDAIAAHLRPSATVPCTQTAREHSSLKAVLNGATSVRHGVTIEQYRGIKYGDISARFQHARMHETVQDGSTEIECTKFGLVCPQNYTSPATLLRIPKDLEDVLEPQDELECLNLTVTVPAGTAQGQDLPVFVWIHGGSQVITFGSMAGRICDPRLMVADSVKMDKPIIFVAMNYRLNIFGFGNGVATNLALKDQALAVEWVRMHIGGFGGDPDNITLAGESAGGVYAHAHAIVGTPVKRVILQSGSLLLSPPMALKAGKSMLKQLSEQLKAADGHTLENAPAKSLLYHMERSGISSMWLQAADGLEDWQKKEEVPRALMIGDCEYDSVIWRNGIETATGSEISRCFDRITASAEIKRAYGIYPDRSTSCKLGALDFITDRCFAMPAQDIWTRWRENGRPAYQYLIDQPNPWQPSSRPHHAVDLVLLFGGYDLSFNPAAEAVGAEMRRRWILFVNGKEPWAPGKRMAFGPTGRSEEIDDKEYSNRRRTRHFDLLRQANQKEVVSAFAALAMGRLSTDN